MRQDRGKGVESAQANSERLSQKWKEGRHVERLMGCFPSMWGWEMEGGVISGIQTSAAHKAHKGLRL